MFDGPIDGGEVASAVLAMPLAVAAGDEARFLGFGIARHLGRTRRCGFHAVLHRDASGGCWTHLYRAVATRGGGRLVLLCRAAPGDVRNGVFAFRAGRCEPRGDEFLGYPNHDRRRS